MNFFRKGSAIGTRLPAIGLVSIATIFTGITAAHADANSTGLDSCANGKFCYWYAENYAGKAQLLDLGQAATNVCIQLPYDYESRSFVNRTTRDVTVYQDGHCSSEGDFRTYPGGTYVPEAPYVARAVEIWDS